MLSLLLDENISPVVARQIHVHRPDIAILSAYYWRNSALTGKDYRLVLAAADQDGLTLVTFDQRTIRPILIEWSAAGLNHAGVLFVDERTIGNHDVGGLVRSLIDQWDNTHLLEWQNRTDYLR